MNRPVPFTLLEAKGVQSAQARKRTSGGVRPWKIKGERIRHRTPRVLYPPSCLKMPTCPKLTGSSLKTVQ